MATHSDEVPVQNGSSLQVSKPSFSPPRKLVSRQGLFTAQVVLRIFAALVSVAAISVLVTSDRSFSVYGIKLEAHYYYSSASRFLLGVDITVCIMSALSLIFIWVSCRSTTNDDTKYYLFLYVHDMVVMLLMISGCAAATAVGHIGRYGEEKMGWDAVCKNVPKFCDQTLASLLLSYLVFVSYFLLTNLSAHNLLISTVTGGGQGGSADPEMK